MGLGQFGDMDDDRDMLFAGEVPGVFIGMDQGRIVLALDLHEFIARMFLISLKAF